METKALKKQMGAAIAMVLVAAIALGAATFAWFVNNTKVTAESVNVSASSANTLLISHANDDKWGTTAAFKSTDSTTFVPVSTIDATTFYKDNKWETEASGADAGKYNASEFTAVQDTDDYYYVDSFKVKASQACGLYLDNETAFTAAPGADENVLKAMRLALVVGGETFFYQIDDSEITDNSYNTTLYALGADGIKKAISGANTADKIGASNMSTEGKVISLTEGEVVKPTDNTVLVDKNDAVKLCDLSANVEQEVKVYIWMEGCDYDCNSAVVKNITEQVMNCKLGFCAGKTA